MILHQDYIIRIEYDPATDIMQVDYPDLHSSQISEVKHSLTRMTDAIRNYDVKKLLIDASTTKLNISDEERDLLSMSLAADLANTRLEKLAHIQPEDPMLIEKSNENIAQIQQAGLLAYQLQMFSDKDKALEWLKAD